MTSNDRVPGERTIAQTPTGMTAAVRLQRALAMILVCGIGGAVLTWYYLDLAKSVHAEGSATSGRRRNDMFTEMKLPSLGPPPALQATKPAEISADGETRMQSDPPAAQGRAAPHAYDPVPEPVRIGSSDLAAAPVAISPVLVRDRSRAVGAPVAVELSAPDRDVAVTEADETYRVPPQHRKEVVVERQASPAGRADVVRDTRWLLPRGTFIDCTLETAIDTTLGGLASCIVATDVFGSDGRIVLLDRGTRLLGEVRSEVHAGQARVGVVWDEARAPNGVIAVLGAPGTDALGRTGIPGTVDRHSADRFGAALLLSLIDGAVNALVAHQQAGGGSVIYNAQGSRDVATEVLRNTMNVSPTIRVAPGARMLVAVARDVDFRDVYTLAKRGGT